MNVKQLQNETPTDTVEIIQGKSQGWTSNADLRSNSVIRRERNQPAIAAYCGFHGRAALRKFTHSKPFLGVFRAFENAFSPSPKDRVQIFVQLDKLFGEGNLPADIPVAQAKWKFTAEPRRGKPYVLKLPVTKKTGKRDQRRLVAFLLIGLVEDTGERLWKTESAAQKDKETAEAKEVFERETAMKPHPTLKGSDFTEVPVWSHDDDFHDFEKYKRAFQILRCIKRTTRSSESAGDEKAKFSAFWQKHDVLSEKTVDHLKPGWMDGTNDLTCELVMAVRARNPRKEELNTAGLELISKRANNDAERGGQPQYQAGIETLKDHPAIPARQPCWCDPHAYPNPARFRDDICRMLRLPER